MTFLAETEHFLWEKKEHFSGKQKHIVQRPNHQQSSQLLFLTTTLWEHICCGSNFSVFFFFSNQFEFYFPSFQIMIMNTRQREIKIKIV